jgi:hypothetical protein
VDSVEAFRFQLAEAFHLHPGDSKTGFLSNGDNLAGLIGSDSVGLDNCERAFHDLLNVIS